MQWMWEKMHHALDFLLILLNFVSMNLQWNFQYKIEISDVA